MPGSIHAPSNPNTSSNPNIGGPLPNCSDRQPRRESEQPPFSLNASGEQPSFSLNASGEQQPEQFHFSRKSSPTPPRPIDDKELALLIHFSSTLRFGPDSGVEGQNSWTLGRDCFQGPEGRKLLAELYGRSPKEIQRICAAISEALKGQGSTFSRKNEKGVYAETFAVPVNGPPVVLEERVLGQLVNSTQKILETNRMLLQALYSKGNDLSWEDVNAILPMALQDQCEAIVEILLNSVYFEPELVCEAMADYPFCPVAGFDAAIDDPDHPSNTFFEANLATPSGLSNNLLMLDLYRALYPESYETFAQYQVDDNTFGNLKTAIDECAKAWTGSDEGISVVIGPGSLNGAHPDVARIAQFSGMPLVTLADLYQVEDGAIYLRGKCPEEDQLVTGIYSRMEESYLLQEGNRVPIRGPQFDLPDSSNGSELERGVLYQCKYKEDANGDFVPVEICYDQNGRPIYQQAFDRMASGRDREGEFNVSMVNAIINKKVFVSVVGGRTADDKRIFATQATALIAQGYTDVARPPESYSPGDEGFEHFLSLKAGDEEIKNYVVKAPDMSGGSGVYIFATMSETERQEVLDKLRKNPRDYVLQKFATYSLIVTPEIDPKTGQTVLGTRASDVRLFIFMGPDGKVTSGANAALVRVAQVGSACTNTSGGGGYTALFVKGPKRNEPWPVTKSLLPKPEVSNVVPASACETLSTFLNQLIVLAKRCDPDNYNRKLEGPIPKTTTKEHGINQYGDPSWIAGQMRSIMNILPMGSQRLMEVLQEFDNEKVSDGDYSDLQTDLFKEIHKYLNAFRRDSEAATPGEVHFMIQEIMAESDYLLDPDRRTVPKPMPLESNPNAVKWYSEDKVQTVSHQAGNEPRTTKIIGNYTDQSSMHCVKDAAEMLAQYGGRLYAARQFDSNGNWSGYAGAYFDVDDKGNPYIVWDETQPYALSALVHEMSHFEDWCEQRAEIRNSPKASNLTDRQISLAAKEETLKPENRVKGEKKALRAEMVCDFVDSPLNSGSIRPPSSPEHQGYTRRLNYPYSTGLSDAIYDEKIKRSRPDPNKGNSNSGESEIMRLCANDIIEHSMRFRQSAMENLNNRIKVCVDELQTLRSVPGIKGGVAAKVSALETQIVRLQARLSKFQEENPWCTNYNNADCANFEKLGVMEPYSKSFWNALERYKVSNESRLKPEEIKRITNWLDRARSSNRNPRAFTLSSSSSFRIASSFQNQ